MWRQRPSHDRDREDDGSRRQAPPKSSGSAGHGNASWQELRVASPSAQAYERRPVTQETSSLGSRKRHHHDESSDGTTPRKTPRPGATGPEPNWGGTRNNPPAPSPLRNEAPTQKPSNTRERERQATSSERSYDTSALRKELDRAAAQASPAAANSPANPRSSTSQSLTTQPLPQTPLEDLRQRLEYIQAQGGTDRDPWNEQIFDHLFTTTMRWKGSLDAAERAAKTTATLNFGVFRVQRDQAREQRSAQLAAAVAPIRQLLQSSGDPPAELQLPGLAAKVRDFQARAARAQIIDDRALVAGRALLRAATLHRANLLPAAARGRPFVLTLTLAASSYGPKTLKRDLAAAQPPAESWEEADFVWEMDLAVVQRALRRHEARECGPGGVDELVALISFYEMVLRSPYEETPTICALYAEEAGSSAGRILP